MEKTITWEPETKRLEGLKHKNVVFEVVIKKLTAGEEADIQDGSTEIKMLGKLEKREFHAGKAKLLGLLKGIVDAPFPHATIEDIKKIPMKLADSIYTELSLLNPIDENEKKSDSGEPSGNPASSQGSG